MSKPRSKRRADSQPVSSPARRRDPRVLGALLLIVAVLGVAAWMLKRSEPKPRARSLGFDWPETPSVLLIGLDTVRADHVCNTELCGVRTPSMDALARDGVRFERCYSTAPWTLPSFASIFTGRLPYEHATVGGDYQRLDDDRTTMAERFDAAGYATSGYMGVAYLTEAYGMTQGYNTNIGTPRMMQDFDRAATVTSLSLEFCRRSRERPFFLFTHHFDPHAPYTPPPPYDQLYYFDRDPRAPGEPILDTIMASPVLLDDTKQSGLYDWLEGVTDWTYPPRQYAAEISYIDEHVGRLLEGLKEMGLYDDMMIILVADHGEHLMDHGIYFTHYLPYQETLHVPLIVKLPGNRGAGRVIADPVSTLDLLPTLLSVTGLEAPGDLEGKNLTRAMVGQGEVGLRTLYAEQGSSPERFSKSVIEYPWKLMYFRTPEGERYALYRLDVDPYEERDLSAARSDIADQLREKLWTRFDPDAPLGADLAVREATLSEAERRRLESLGYVD